MEESEILLERIAPNKNKILIANSNINIPVAYHQKRICLIYVYYERKNEQKNQTNLSFFHKSRS